MTRDYPAEGVREVGGRGWRAAELHDADVGQGREGGALVVFILARGEQVLLGAQRTRRRRGQRAGRGGGSRRHSAWRRGEW